jgi:hypothetical protein
VQFFGINLSQTVCVDLNNIFQSNWPPRSEQLIREKAKFDQNANESGNNAAKGPSNRSDLTPLCFLFVKARFGRLKCARAWPRRLQVENFQRENPSDPGFVYPTLASSGRGTVHCSTNFIVRIVSLVHGLSNEPSLGRIQGGPFSAIFNRNILHFQRNRSVPAILGVLWHF